MRILFLILGLISLGVGAVGAVLPLLPSTPFLLAAAFCFAKSSKKLHDWFLSTKLYKKHLDSFVKKRAMTLKAKLSIMLTVTLMMSVGFILMHSVPIGRICLVAVWLFHLLYFTFRIKTIRPETQLTNN
ncbi:hypothetical protein CLOSTMETH_01876 [[Clostridium] methylpentosum DSM 5476]|jgi:uncharacterized protein|uniref:Inner membrane protein YbaN n=1 Tax=[Clostridium] methylpentosum DSM 5476 TaxID=537013 RepID=C0EDE9_9FIRM|nr:hypothetical protein CLOSTMETH_01876 [[Clostridium] methylpentosum DSM 5476]MDY3990047.1 YbaN family protein [Massilioclostridium sp.]MEE1491602.1 YbaN family protein [Massilioclostridium sp.]